MQGEDKVGEEWLNKKEPVGDDLGNSQLIQIAQEAKIKRYTVRNVWSKDNAEGVAVRASFQYFKMSQYPVTRRVLGRDGECDSRTLSITENI